jgi:hypothetical protein
MVDANVSGDTGRPDPAEATTPAEFVEAMRSLKRWTGWGFRELEKRATVGGHVLPRSTVTVALTRDALPREELVAAFAHACGCDEEETARWVTARRRVAAAGAPALAAPAPETEPVSAPESASSSPAKTTPALESEPASPVEAGPVAPPRLVRRRVQRLVPVLAALAAVATIVTFLLGSAGRDDAQPGGTHTAPTSPPGTSRHGTPRHDPTQASDPGAMPASESVPTTAAEPGQVVPAAAKTPDPPEPPGTQDPTHEPPPQEPADPDHVTIPLEDQPPVHCPLPYLNTPYGAVAQCTQMSGGQARIGFYSFVTGEFGPQTDWADVVEDRWFDGSIAATDGVEAVARGFAVLNTTYGGGVFATQYRDGEARWGTINVVTGKFYPSSDQWTPL